ncbi:hypothetical protein GCM10018966_069750 [Streptomyces yanii]
MKINGTPFADHADDARHQVVTPMDDGVVVGTGSGGEWSWSAYVGGVAPHNRDPIPWGFLHRRPVVRPPGAKRTKVV